jgi:hypothetical protein
LQREFQGVNDEIYAHGCSFSTRRSGVVRSMHPPRLIETPVLAQRTDDRICVDVFDLPPEIWVDQSSG